MKMKKKYRMKRLRQAYDTYVQCILDQLTSAKNPIFIRDNP